MDVKHTFLIALVVVLLYGKVQSTQASYRLKWNIASHFRRTACNGGNLMKISRNMCRVVNGKKQCKVYWNGRIELNNNAIFYIVKSKKNSKRCIQKIVESIIYSLKVINGTNVVFEEQSACNKATSNDFLFKEEKNITTAIYTYKYTSTTNQVMYLGASTNCSDHNLYVYSANKIDGRFYLAKKIRRP